MLDVVNIFVANVLLSYCIFLCLVYLCSLINRLHKQLFELNSINKNISLFNAKSKEIDNEVHRIKSKSLDIAENNILLRNRYNAIQNELLKIRYTQLQNHKDILQLRSLSLDT